METCFFLEKEGRGRELGSGDTANADPAYMSAYTVDLTSRRPCFGLTSFLDGTPLLSLESSDSPRRRMVTFSMTRLPSLRSSELDPGDLRSSGVDLFEIAGSDEALLLRSGFSKRTAGCGFLLDLVWLENELP